MRDRIKWAIAGLAEVAAARGACFDRRLGEIVLIIGAGSIGLQLGAHIAWHLFP